MVISLSSIITHATASVSHRDYTLVDKTTFLSLSPKNVQYDASYYSYRIRLRRGINVRGKSDILLSSKFYYTNKWTEFDQ